jgi:hypothetical protein
VERDDTRHVVLERARLHDRSRRIELALAALRERAASDARTGDVPPPLRQAIAGFGSDLVSVRRRLRTLGGDGSGARGGPR